jgi:hypothetical protein
VILCIKKNLLDKEMETNTKAIIVLSVFLIITTTMSVIALVTGGKKGDQGEPGISGIAGSTDNSTDSAGNTGSAGADVGSGVTGRNWSTVFSWGRLPVHVLAPTAATLQKLYFPFLKTNTMALPNIITYTGKGVQPYTITKSTASTTFGIQFLQDGQYMIGGSYNLVKKTGPATAGIAMYLQSVNTNSGSSATIVVSSPGSIDSFVVQSCKVMMTTGQQLNKNDIYSLVMVSNNGPVWTELESATLTVEYLGTPKVHK